jgi:hypothetical protein
VSTVKRFRVQSRLAAIAFQGGGLSANQALKQADKALEPLRPACLAAIDAAIAEIDTRFGRDANARGGEPTEDLYLLSSSVIDAGLFVQGSGLVEAAQSLCGLVDLSRELGTWSWAAVDVHIEALKLLRLAGATMSDAERASILDGLAKVTVKCVGDPSDFLGTIKTN